LIFRQLPSFIRVTFSARSALIFDQFIALNFILHVVTFISPEGERVTAEAAYLTDDVLKRPNLKVAVGARVTRILISGAEKRATGVAFADDVPQGGRRRTYIARAKREVVMACVCFSH
jgi:choline dehydrogenase-like flavoprotein